jgi:hypothetical protein
VLFAVAQAPYPSFSVAMAGNFRAPTGARVLNDRGSFSLAPFGAARPAEDR